MRTVISNQPYDLHIIHQFMQIYASTIQLITVKRILYNLHRRLRLILNISIQKDVIIFFILLYIVVVIFFYVYMIIGY